MGLYQLQHRIWPFSRPCSNSLLSLLCNLAESLTLQSVVFEGVSTAYCRWLRSDHRWIDIQVAKVTLRKANDIFENC